jgi:hypothetical protein
VAGCYTPALSYQFNSRGETNTVCRLGTGEYEATLPRMEKHTFEPSNGGHVQVTAYGGGAERCKVRGWSQVGTSLRARVGCVNSSGSAVDARFTLSFLRSPGTLATSVAEDTLEGFFVWGNTTPQPSSFYQSDSYGGHDATMQQIGSGFYRVHLPGVKSINDSTAQVSAYGSGDAYCTVNSWSTDVSSNGTAVDVRCFNSAGTAVDSMFTLHYLTNRIIFY